MTVVRAASLGDGQSMRVGLALLGAAMIAFVVTLNVWVARKMREPGEPIAAWRRVARSGMLWAGVVCLLVPVSPAAAGALAVLLMVFALVQVLQGVRAFPAVWRTIGESDAWRGRV